MRGHVTAYTTDSSKLFWRILLVAFLLLVKVNLSASEILQPEQTLEGKIDYFEDPLAAIKPEQLLSQEIQQKFKPVVTDSFGVSNSAWWFRIKINFTTDAQQTRLLLLDNPLIWDARLYQIKNNIAVEIARGGFAFPVKDRPIFDSRLIFPLSDQSQPTFYYLRVHNKGSVQLPLIIAKPEKMMGDRNMIHWIMGIYFGLLFSMAIYNFFIGWSTGDKAYFYYVAYLLALSLMIALNEGYGQLLLFPDSPYTAYASINWAAAAIIIFASQFARTFLNSPANTPRIDRWLKFNIVLSIIYLIINNFFDGASKANSILLLSLIFLVSMFSVGFSAWRKKVPAAQYFLSAWLLMLLGSSLTVLMKLSIIPSFVLSEFGVQWGSAAEAMLLSFALASKIKRLQEERITIEARARQSLEFSNKKLAESHKIKDDFFSLLSHELRTPIHGVRGGIDLLTLESLSPEQSKSLSILNESTDEMLNYIDHLLVLSQLKTGKLTLVELPFNLKLMFIKLQRHFTLLAKERQISFNLKLPENIEQKVIGDERVLAVTIYQLMSDVFDNKEVVAIDLQLSLTSTGQPSPSSDKNKLRLKATLCCQQKQRTLNFEFPKVNENNNLNQPEYDAVTSRTETEYSSNQKGIIRINREFQKKLTEILGASLESQTLDQEHWQSELIIEFDRVESVDTQQQNEEPKESNNQLVGLVVDDNAINRLVAQKYLETLGYQVESANDGQSAIEMVNQKAFDFILMDCHMPILNGYKATEAIKSNPLKANIPIIALTADVTSESRSACIKAGMSPILHKPLSLHDLQTALNHLGL